ncbi:glucose-1-phosphate adenylyltransferase [Brachyspira hyodysenteriae]|uniref:Glucose-1-phosphate adenylyltransferase n=2 Tax=Brachyspira hyodysenteriae TaxID=159 RepID=A0A3B6V7U7_BRAHW|nr:glucose-1-phosphate adenylyltransferase [Brachyspira hyodysenteriae]ACN82586.1 glucose-1-phosphate adenylyltransferase [Brachyspira hyodysenteriae WA1]ANN62781.1 glucose-1-phosphate adenylyltransferase [Brachyspira hyodysenteriae ATCC 27164]AUJ50911.1 glucose-1-phosphate adenylyltransferase [Brachyspira hyodysenteriae]KLI13358.1 glucose-1-phosphate adenylyltransferase [Brachyspira hyodysenteriae]KLI14183.1 glucose-1-phosphate adenylyltransferase [Brachyspira hyodysenteriae]
MRAFNTVALILGGGRGTRLYPLVKARSKPAVSLGGQYRMIDIPVSNCINSGFRNIYVITQFNSASLNNHIYNAYRFDNFSGGHVSILAAEQTDTNIDWYQGTADAVRKNLPHFDNEFVNNVVILSGDQVYRMNYNVMLQHMLETGADIVVGTVPVVREDAKGFGVMLVNKRGQITNFMEKPKEAEELDSLKLSEDQKKMFNIEDPNKEYLASMGIYVFRRNVLKEILEDVSMMDFGKDIIPEAIKKYKVFSYAFQGYWEDVGTIKAYFEANISFGSKNPPFDFYDENAPIYTHVRYLSPSKVEKASVTSSIIADGCRIENATIKECVIGVRSVVQSGSTLERVVMMGSDYYEDSDDIERLNVKHIPKIGIGKKCTLKNVIIDKNVRIGNDVVITNKKKIQHQDSEFYCIRDGIVIIPKNTIVKSGTII